MHRIYLIFPGQGANTRRPDRVRIARARACVYRVSGVEEHRSRAGRAASAFRGGCSRSAAGARTCPRAAAFGRDTCGLRTRALYGPVHCGMLYERERASGPGERMSADAVWPYVQRSQKCPPRCPVSIPLCCARMPPSCPLPSHDAQNSPTSIRPGSGTNTPRVAGTTQ